jgi:hypothetical protein
VRHLQHAVLPCTIPALATNLSPVSFVLSAGVNVSSGSPPHFTYQGGRVVFVDVVGESGQVAEESYEGAGVIIGRECCGAGHGAGGSSKWGWM